MEKIIVRGERCTGTNYLYKLIENNFGKEILFDLGWKHSYLNIFDPELHNKDNYLILFIFRNPTDWISSFYNEMWHFDKVQYSNISEFIRKEPIQINDGFSELKKFPITDELFWERHPFTLERPRNLCQLRNWKNQNYLNTSKIFHNVIFIKYEDLCDDPKNIIDNINNKYFNFEYEFKNVRTYKGENNSNFYKPKKYPKLSDEDLEFIKNNIDWNIEAKIGYSINDIK